MAISETVIDPNFPDVELTVTLDLEKTIPLNNQGDEIYVNTSAVSTAVTSKIDGGTISPITLTTFKAGYSKSSGRAIPPFTIASGSNQLNVDVDGSGPVTITLSSGIALTGEDVAKDMQAQLNSLAASGSVQAGNLGFLNLTVEFKNNRFRLVSGTISDTYTGVNRSSVVVTSGANSAINILGFDMPVESFSLSSKLPIETPLVSTYTASGSTLYVGSVTHYSANEAFTITDGINREYFIASGVDSGLSTITILGSGGLTNSYATGALVQKIFERDPESAIASPYEDIDALVRFSLRSLANQADFS